MPKINLTDDLYERLGRRARPFESPAEVIRRLLDEKEGGQPPRVPLRTGRPRRPRGDSLRGAVAHRWEEEGRPNWDIDGTIRVCEEEDEVFRQAGENPAPRFREARNREDITYVRTWVYGCHFPWLNPR
jgi:hypothetical protein